MQFLREYNFLLSLAFKKKKHLELVLGNQTNVEFYGCSSRIIDSAELVEKMLLDAASLINLTVVNTTIHHFSPIGVSGVIVIEESHIAVHTWPEYDYVAIDFFTCNQTYEIAKAIDFLFNKLEATAKEVVHLKRGSITSINKYKTK